ncbi:MAG: aminotransferase class I/II-fold pyridoxal phosphate-dependent enzyme [Chloroflexia bacterium]|nr:aminotransferase class I/II-fold pyridoxal phosphate-dependent enzyme [Chloroflexia bacterium]
MTEIEPQPASEGRPAAPARHDHHRAPLVEGIGRYQEDSIVPFSTPGHKGGQCVDDQFRTLLGAAAFAADIPLGGGVDDTHFHGDSLGRAEALAAAVWGAERSFYLVNGSSAGNHAFLLATLRPGDEVIVARDLHKSLLVALILTGARPVYVAPRLHPRLNVGLGVVAADVDAALRDHPAARLVALVSPSYCGVPSDLAAIVEVAHHYDVPVFVDEAWGPHFHLHPDLPPSAMSSGADGAVISTHKVLGSLTQAAILHLQGSRIDHQRVAAAVGMMQTTSPAATILASIDGCRRQMALHGRALLERAIALAHDARARLLALPGIEVLDAARLGIPALDPTKLVIDVHGLGLTGFRAEAELRDRFGVQPEMSDLVGVVCLVTIGDTTASIERLVGAFTTLATERRTVVDVGAGFLARSSGAAIAPGVQALSPRDAFFAPSRVVALRDAVGEVSAELVIPYPPGIPVLAPGDVVSVEKVAYLEAGAAHGMYLSGPADPALKTLRVVAS